MYMDFQKPSTNYPTMAAKQDENGDINKGAENQAAVTETVMLDSDGSSESHVDEGCECATTATKTAGRCINFSCSSCVLGIPPFLLKLYDMLVNNETNSIVLWSSTGTSFVVTNPHSFAAKVLPKYFRHCNFQSFVTQLNSYGFKKISWDRWEYRNDNFRKGERHLLRNIKRRNQQFLHTIHSSSQPGPISITEKELEITMKEHDLLKLEITKLKEKQETLEQKLASLKNQAICNRNDQQRMMFAAHRIITKRRDPTQTPDDEHLKGKRKIEEKLPLMCADSGNISTGNIVEMISEHFCRQGEMVLDEEHQLGKDRSNTFIPLEDLIGESSDWVEYVRKLQENANQIKS